MLESETGSRRWNISSHIVYKIISYSIWKFIYILYYVFVNLKYVHTLKRKPWIINIYFTDFLQNYKSKLCKLIHNKKLKINKLHTSILS